MDLDALLHYYFATADLGAVSAADLARGLEQLTFDFHDERDPGRRFALWTLMHVLGVAPSPDEAFATEADRTAARAFAKATGNLS